MTRRYRNAVGEPLRGRRTSGGTGRPARSIARAFLLAHFITYGSLPC
jgi:hypothetical protein